MSEKNSFTRFAEGLGISPKLLLHRFKLHNKNLGDDALHERTLELMEHNGIKLAQKKTREFITSFLASHHRPPGNRSFAETSEVFRELKERGEISDVPEPQKYGRTFKDLQAFGAMVSSREAQSDDLARSRANATGTYHVVRKTTDVTQENYYAEPIKIADHDAESWLITANNGVAKGFVVPSMGMVTVILYHKDGRLGTGIIAIMVPIAEGLDLPLYPGVMLRLSDTQPIPTSTQIWLRPTSNADPVSDWAALAERPEEEIELSETKEHVEILKEGPLFETYERLGALIAADAGSEDGRYLGIPNDTAWRSALKKVGLFDGNN